MRADVKFLDTSSAEHYRPFDKYLYRRMVIDYPLAGDIVLAEYGDIKFKNGLRGTIVKVTSGYQCWCVFDDYPEYEFGLPMHYLRILSSAEDLDEAIHRGFPKKPYIGQVFYSNRAKYVWSIVPGNWEEWVEVTRNLTPDFVHNGPQSWPQKDYIWHNPEWTQEWIKERYNG